MPFTASIVERNFAYVPDKILRLGGASWLRPLGGPALSAPWERIRLGVLCAVTPNDTSNISDVFFLLGLCAGQEAPGSAFTTLNFVGASMIGAATTGAARLLTYNAGAGNPYFSCTAGVAFHKMNVTNLETSAAFGSGLLLPLANTGFYPRRSIIILDITKSLGGTGNLTFAVYYITAAATIQGTDLRPDHLFAALDQPGAPNVRGTGAFTTALNSTALNYSPLGGEADTFEIFWSSTTFPLEISALGASILRPLSYTGTAALGVADDTFESYALSSGSITTELTGGSGWSSPGAMTSYPFYNDGTLGNSSNLAPQVYTQYVGTTNSPDESFEQYVTGSVYSGSTVNLGSYWTAAAAIASTADYNAGTLGFSGNFEPQVYTQYVGTTNSPNDNFEQYATGTVDSGTTVSLGTFWAGPLTDTAFNSNLSPQIQDEWVGTTTGGPYDTWESYGTNDADNGTIQSFVYGSYWESAGTIYSYGTFLYIGTSTSNPYPQVGLIGTTTGGPYDTWESYGTGTVVSGETINAFGSLWDSYGTIYAFTYP